MAEAALLGVAKSVLGQLSSPALKEFFLVWDFKKDLKRLGKTIETITCFIHDAEQRQSKEHLIKLWLSRLREVLYEADDLFDVVGSMVLRKKAMGGNKFKKEVTLFFSKSNQLVFVVKIAHEIKAIKECLDDIKGDMSPFQFRYQQIEETRPRSVLHRDETHSYVDFRNVIGRDKEKEDIINLLLSEDHGKQNCKVVSIIGFGGLGKTTLAQLVYNDERVQKGFDLCLWACVNYFSDLKSVLMKILTSEAQCRNLDELQREFRKHIEEKKYLLVLDDVWDDNPSNWDRLGTLLNCGRNGSKVLMTTRKAKVAQCLDAIEPYYRLNVLSEESAWSLFVKMAFKDGEFDSDSELVSVGKQILRKCGYVPLVLSTIGRILCYRKKDKREWLSFVENELPEVFSFDDDQFMHVLKVSYNDLPLALKHCFAYCSVFPKDYRFDKDELVRMWVAQGFVETYAKKSLEEVGDDYFFHLVVRCFFQEIERVENDNGIVKYGCKMHDLLHDLAIQVAGLESNCFEEEDLREIVERSALRHISVKCARGCSFDFSNMSSHSKTLRTLRLIHTGYLEINSLSLALEMFRMLRTLDLSWLDFEKLPDSFGGLIHLRYLNLTHNTKLTVLPNSICKLHRLQILMLSGCNKLKQLPLNFRKLVSLRHLHLNYCHGLDSLPLGFAGLTTLVSLDRFIVHPHSGGLRYLGCLNELSGMLKIELPKHGWTNCIEDARKSNMTSKGKLSGMVVEWIGGDTKGDMMEEERKAVLEELQPHANLQYLKIDNYINDNLPSWFSSLSNIKRLSLQNCTVEYLDMSVSSGYLLPCLEFLELISLTQLKGWWREATTSPRGNAQKSSTVQRLPRVSKLVISDCKSLTENMPFFGVVEELTLGRVDVKLVKMLFSNPNAQCVSEFHGLSKLKRIDLDGIKGMKCLPEGWINHFSALKTLKIKDCLELSWVSSRGLACLTSVEKLEIECGKVRLEDEDDDEDINNGLRLIPWKDLNRLRKLVMPWQRHLQEGLQYLTFLQDLNLEYYEAQQVETDNAAQDLMEGRAMKFQGLERLQKVELSSGLKELWSSVPHFPKWIMCLPCLQELTIKSYGETKFDDWVAQHAEFKSLLSLSICSYNEVTYWVDDISWKMFPSLRILSIGFELRSIPDGIQHLTSLRELQIWCTASLNEMPKWMINLTSLQLFGLWGCSTELAERCAPETGVDWPLISHIPTIRIPKKNKP